MSLRHAPLSLALACFLAGCGPLDGVVNVLGTLAGEPSGAGGPAIAGGSLLAEPVALEDKPRLSLSNMSLMGAGRALAPLDLAGQTWVADQPGGFEVGADRIVVAGAPGRHILFYNKPLGDVFTLRFTESRNDVNGALVIHWMLDPIHETSKAAVAIAANGTLALASNGEATVRGAGKTQGTKKAPAGPRRWVVAVDEEGFAEVTVNDERVARYELPGGYADAPFLAIEAQVSGTTPMALTDVAVESGEPSRYQAVLHQWSLEGRSSSLKRFTTLWPSGMANVAPLEKVGTLAGLLPYVEAIAGGAIDPASAIFLARAVSMPGGTYHGRWIQMHPSHMLAFTTSAHEMAHAYGKGGSPERDAGDHWLVEGLAEYIGYHAFARYLGYPVWLAPAELWVPDYDPPLSERDEDAPEGSDLNFKDYTKGRIFLDVLATATSPEDVRAVIQANRRAKAKVTGEGFVAALEAQSGKDLAWVRPGWLVPGAYTRWTPKDARDSDQDGLLNFQEMAWGTDPQLGDTDGDGATDYKERVAGTDGKNAASRP